jgi:hypothetical protein
VTLITLALVSQTDAISGRGDCTAPRVVLKVTSTVPVLTVLAASVFRYDATALSFATVRWRGVRTHKSGHIRVVRCLECLQSRSQGCC